MAPREYLLVVPPMGLDGRRLIVTNWYVPLGGRVAGGERLVELTAAEVTIDVPCPVSGVLLARLSDEDQPVAEGQAVARLQVD